MTVLSDRTLRGCQRIITPFFEQQRFNGMTFGLGPCGYDIRVAENLMINPGGFVLGSSVEYFNIPDDVVGIVHDKSTWARRGLAVQNTVLEPGWRGWLTLELTNHRPITDGPIFISPGSPIAQVIFHKLDQPASIPYKGKYQDQLSGVQPAILQD